MSQTIRILNKALPGAIIPVTNVRSYSDLCLLAQSGSLVVDDFAVRFVTAAFEVPQGDVPVEFCLGVSVLFPIRNETAPFAMLLNQHIVATERQSAAKAPTSYFTFTAKVDPISVTSDTRTPRATIHKVGGSDTWPHGLECELFCKEDLATQADEVIYGRNFVDWNAWPNNTLMMWYLLRITGNRDTSKKFPALSVCIYGSFAMTRGG
jgi:hypothetical protein